MAYKIEAVQFVDGELYRPQVIEMTRVEGMKAEEILFVQLNNTAIADITNGYTATFTGKILATPPTGFLPLSTSDFEVYLNGRRVPASQITSITQIGVDLNTYAIELVVDVPAFFENASAVFEANDEVILIGKFN